MDKTMSMIEYPEPLPEGRIIEYVPARNEYMRAACKYALAFSLDKAVKTGSVLVKNNAIIGYGANGSDYHEKHGCERVRLGIPTGERYELCEGCHPKNHSEIRAIEDARSLGNDTGGADLYLWGHWWCCKACWQAIIEANIEHVYLVEGSERYFKKGHPDSVLGKW